MVAPLQCLALLPGHHLQRAQPLPVEIKKRRPALAAQACAEHAGQYPQSAPRERQRRGAHRRRGGTGVEHAAAGRAEGRIQLLRRAVQTRRDQPQVLREVLPSGVRQHAAYQRSVRRMRPCSAAGPCGVQLIAGTGRSERTNSHINVEVIEAAGKTLRNAVNDPVKSSSFSEAVKL